MKFQPNEVQARSRAAAAVLMIVMFFLVGSFFRAQVVLHDAYRLAAEENRLREVPLPSPRALIRDRHGAVIAENVPGYTVSVLAPRPDSLRAVLERVTTVIPMNEDRKSTRLNSSHT